ncbi:MAG: hypothetical protein Q8R24_07400 [Legionellaceae bacterium]|nr:hypothetical protein [Legionellaceae bacterium]
MKQLTELNHYSETKLAKLNTYVMANYKNFNNELAVRLRLLNTPQSSDQNIDLSTRKLIADAIRFAFTPYPSFENFFFDTFVPCSLLAVTHIACRAIEQNPRTNTEEEEDEDDVKETLGKNILNAVGTLLHIGGFYLASQLIKITRFLGTLLVMGRCVASKIYENAQSCVTFFRNHDLDNNSKPEQGKKSDNKQSTQEEGTELYEIHKNNNSAESAHV